MKLSLWYKDKQKFKLGDVCRYRIQYTNSDPQRTGIFLRVKNIENTGLRAIHLLNGPFILYGHVVPCNYKSNELFEPKNADSNSEVCFTNSLKPGQTFNVHLYLNDNSKLRQNPDGSTTHEWSCDLVSQIVLNRRVSILYVLLIGDNIAEMRRASRSTLTSIAKGDFASPETTHISNDHLGEVTNPDLCVNRQTTSDLWNRQPRIPGKPVHLVIITHGLFSNLTADMLYIRDAILNCTSENYLVDGCRENAGRTEKGVHRLGQNVCNHVLKLLEDLEREKCTVSEISFVAHSLGGPVQLYAIKQIMLLKGTDFFEKKNIKLRNFVCLASPMLGVLSEMSLLISWFLDLGTLGKTGRDLTLLKKLPSVTRHGDNHVSSRPLLETLPDDPAETALRMFRLRVVYANAVNDGIVPLRTSALLYLDWEALGDVKELQHHKLDDGFKNASADLSRSASTPLSPENTGGKSVGQIPEDVGSKIGDKSSGFLTRVFNLESYGPQGKAQRRKRVSNRVKRYAKISAKSSDLNAEGGGDDEETACSDGKEDTTFFNIPPKASAVESAINSMICPTPSLEYINDPESRTPVIFHDKFYHFSSIPDEKSKVGILSKFFRYYDWRMDKQVKIARKYHASDLSWRKVLVYLPPDAHNNIAVRRRFANGYGWGVIDHLKANIFDEGKLNAKF